MKAALKSEYRKLLTLRSTYGWTLLVLLFVCFITFYGVGWHADHKDLMNHEFLSQVVTTAMAVTNAAAFIAILLMTHEYRYNTIVYTLTRARSRSAVLLSKFIVISSYALLLALIVGALAPLMAYLGVAASGHALVSQSFHAWDLAWRSIFYVWAYGTMALALAALIRNQVAALVTVFFASGIVESLLSLLLKKDAVYLPFTSLSQVLGGHVALGNGSLSAGVAALVFICYLAVAWLAAWALFLKRDAG